ncbi:MAG: murein biosynthesis integral membrane protein MurJ [Candidatus Omnitrophota bacterium]
MSTNKSVVKSAGIIGIATLCSRILGLLRDIVIARIFGVYIYAQAFVVAFKIPNLLRDLVGEGATNAAFVPVFSEYRIRHNQEEFWELANVVLNLLLVILSVLVILGVIFSPLIVRLVAPGFMADPEKLSATIKLNRLIFPYVLLISLAAYCMGILNSLKHFTVPAFAPCLLNISVIIFALFFGEGIGGLACGILIGGFLQLAVQIPVLYRKGFRVNLFKRFHHPVANTIGKLMLPRLVSSGIYQLNSLVDSAFGSLAFMVGEGGVAGLYFAYRLIQFPMGIFSNALSQAILPAFSVLAAEGQTDKLKETLSFGLRAVFLVMLPASVGFMVLAHPIIQAIFEGGRFDSYSTHMTARVLFFYSIGLFAYGSTKMLQSCFFALKDTVTPTKVSALALAMNIALNAILMFPMKLSGLALATSLSGINTSLILFLLLRKRLMPFNVRPILSSFLRILAASLSMGMVCYFLNGKGLTADSGIAEKAAGLVIMITLGVVSYVVFCFIFRVREMHEMWQWLIKKKNLIGLRTGA